MNDRSSDYKNTAQVEICRKKRTENSVKIRKNARGNLINRRRKLENEEITNPLKRLKLTKLFVDFMTETKVVKNIKFKSQKIKALQ